MHVTYQKSLNVYAVKIMWNFFKYRQFYKNILYIRNLSKNNWFKIYLNIIIACNE